MNHQRTALAAIALTAGAVVLAACGSASESPEAAEATQSSSSSPGSSASTPPESEVSPTPSDSASDTSATEEAPDSADAGPFLVDTITDPVRYPVEVSSVLSDVQGDIPVEQYSVQWTYDYFPDAEGNFNLVRSYGLDPNVELPEQESDSDTNVWTCLESADSGSRGCGARDGGFSLNSDGGYEVYTEEYERGGGDSVKGSKVNLGTFTYTKPAQDEALNPALCELTGGSAVLEGSKYVITIDHTGNCSAPDAWLGKVVGIATIDDLPPSTFGSLNIQEISHTATETVVSFPLDDVQRGLDFMGFDGSELTGFLATSGSYAPGYEASSIRIDL